MKTAAKEVNGVDVGVLKNTVEEIRKNPALGQCEFRLKNRWVKGDENRSSVHDFYAAGGEQKHKKTFQFQAGEAALLGGKDEGANPVEFLLSALSGCMTTTLAYYCALNGYKIEKMESDYKVKLEVFEGPLTLATAANGGYFGGGMHVAPRARFDDAELDVVIISGLSKLRLLAKLAKLYTGAHMDDAAVSFFRGRRIEFDAASTPVRIEVDGEPLGATAARVEILPAAITLIGPAPPGPAPAGE